MIKLESNILNLNEHVPASAQWTGCLYTASEFLIVWMERRRWEGIYPNPMHVYVLAWGETLWAETIGVLFGGSVGGGVDVIET
jgi:hypothetical protein